MKKVMSHKVTGLFALLFIMASNYSNAQDLAKTIEVKNDTGQDLYVALIKGVVGVVGIVFYADKDSIRIPGGNGLLKAGSSISINNFPKNPQGNYTHMLWYSQEAPVANQPFPFQSGSTIGLEYSTGQQTVMGEIPVVNGTIKVSIFKSGEVVGASGIIPSYSYEFLSK